MKKIKYGFLGISLLVVNSVNVKAETTHDTNQTDSNLNNNTHQLDTISVTANRDEEATLDVSASISVIDQQTIELDQPHYQKDLLNAVSGVRVTQTGSSLGHMTSIRMPLNTGSYYLFLQDGIPVQSSGFFNHNGLAYTNFTSAGSAEVLKGAGTALYGSDAIAGTINVMSKDPSQGQGVTINSNIGSDGFYKLGFNAGHQYSNDASIGMSISQSESDGWRDHSRSKRTEANITHFTTLDDRNAFKTIISLNSSEADMAGSLIGLDALKDNPESVGDIQAALDSGLEIQRKFDFARISTEWTHYLNDSIELSTIGYLRKNRNQYTATWEKNLPKNDSKTSTLGLMFKADIDEDYVRWTMGADVEATKANRTYQQLFDYVPSGFGSAVPAGDIYDYDVEYFAFSPYVQTEFDLSDKFQISGGLRYDTSKYDYDNNLADGQYASSNYSRPSSNNDPSFKHLSPKLSATYFLDAQQNVYARFANGFRIPQASRLYALKTNNIDFDLDPEVSDTFEIGYKLSSDKHRLDAAIYFMTIDDTFTQRENIDGDRYYENGGETQHKGVELTWLTKINEQFSTRLAYSYSEHKYVNDDEYGNNEQAAAPNDLANLRFIFSPKNVKGFKAIVEFEHIGEYWLDNQNTETYSGYTVGHLKADYQITKQLKVNAKINNISNKIYAESASLSYGKEKYTPGSPRQVFAGLEYSFQ
ncbi:MAG: outer membrane receptor protein involved in Fe transport [Oleiphilaceae bacterium]